MSLEQELRRALKRKDPSSGFDDRVLSTIASGATLGDPPSRRRAHRAWLALAASLTFVFGATYYLEQQNEGQVQEQRARTAQAAHDVVLALQIASEKISAAQARIEEMNRHDPTNHR